MPLITDTVSAIVKRETAQQHAAAEAVLLPKLASIYNKEDYAALLKMFYGFFEPVYQLIRLQPVLDDLPDRRSSAWILDDLHSLSLPADNIPVATALPHLGNKARAFGALYVLEGSTLGGRLIKKMMMKNEHWPVPEESLCFFNGHGSDTGLMWTAFQAKLNEQQNAEEIIESAGETFTLFRDWIRQSLYA